ncbi:MAG TPA: DUF2231 domain-containing protein [Syntrophales bacterium]|nr:DUF2231 domain-containing protein [Syntrophales bacterium]
MIEALFPGIQHLQNTHPLVVHFPIAVLFGSALFYLLVPLSSSEALATTAFSLLIIGILVAAAAVRSCIYAEPGVILASSVRGYLLEKHQNFMIMTLFIGAVLAIWSIIARPFLRKGRALFIPLCFALLAVMPIGVAYGALMVYDYNAGGHAYPQPIEFVK